MGKVCVCVCEMKVHQIVPITGRGLRMFLAGFEGVLNGIKRIMDNYGVNFVDEVSIMH